MNDMQQKPRLLAIDDHADSAELITRVAAGVGYEARASTKPDATRKTLAAWNPDIVTLDLCMPEEDGFGVFSLLEEQGFAGRIVIVSGHDEWLRRSATRLGSARGLNIAGNLSKPVDLRKLRELLSGLQVKA